RKLASAISALLAKAAILAKPFEEQSAAALEIHVDELGLSERSANCLRCAHIVTVRDLMQKTEREVLQMPNFGRQSLAEIRAVLGEFGLSLHKTVRGADTTSTADKLASDLRLIAARHRTILSQEEITSLELAAQRLGEETELHLGVPL